LEKGAMFKQASENVGSWEPGFQALFLRKRQKTMGNGRIMTESTAICRALKFFLRPDV